MVGDSGAGGTKGLVPAPASGDAAASKFLRADGAWAVPAGGGGAASMVRLKDGNGHGATNTVIRRWATTVSSSGADITYADSAANGATFTINTSGVYAIAYTEEGNAGLPLFGITLNSVSLTTAINSVAESEILTLSNVASGNGRAAVAWTGLLAATDVIRCHTNSGGGNTFVDNINNFTIVGPL
jgi:hypothetical protein